MNPHPFLLRAVLVFLSFTSLLFSSACSELYALREIKTKQDEQIHNLSAQLSAKSDENARLAAQMESDSNALKRQLEASRDETRRALNERSEREQRLAAANTQLQQKLDEQVFDLNRYKQREEDWKAQEKKLNSDSQAKIAELAAAKEEQNRLGREVSSLEKKLRQAEESSGQQAKTIQSQQADLQTAETRFAELEKDNKVLEELADQQKALLEAAKVESKQAKEIAKALEDAKKRLATAQANATPSAAKADDQDLKDAFALLQPTLKPLAENNFAAVIRNERGVAVRLSADYLFQQGSVQLAENALPVLDEIAAVLKRFPNKYIEVQGHTDAQPLISMPFEDNWGLASERALKVVRYFVTQAGISPSRIKSVSCSEFRPVPKDEEGAFLTRRVEILLTPIP